MNGFRTSGIWPLDAEIFDVEDFAAVLPVSDDSVSAEVDESLNNTSRNPDGEEMATEGNSSCGTQDPQSSISSTGQPCDENRIDSTRTKVVLASSDGRCLFRSLVIGMDPTLQSCERDEDGKPTDVLLQIRERSKSDALRVQLITYMCEHANDFSMLDGEVLNADLPQRIRYSSLNDRILDNAIPTTMPEEMEIVCLAKVLKNLIHVVGEDDMFISRYGDDAIGNSPLTVRYRRVGEDVGHYDCLLRNNMNRSFEQVNASETRDIIHGISPLPKRLPMKTKRARKTESAAILTSSPYQKSLQERSKNVRRKPKSRYTTSEEKCT